MHATVYIIYLIMMNIHFSHSDNEIDGVAFVDITKEDLERLLPIGIVLKLIRIQKVCFCVRYT